MKKYVGQILTLITILLINILPTIVFANESNLQTQELKVLVIEINPWLETQEMKAATYLGMEEDVSLAVEELIEDIEYSSHGNVDVNIVKTEWLNEFCSYRDTVNLINGSIAHRFDEETWLDIMKDGWYGFWDDPRVKEIDAFSFDAEYIIEKFDLVNRRNNNEFDQVWLVNIDPANTYESEMVGRTAYYINGEPIIRDCENFAMMNVSISRRDANFECFGHMMEFIMAQVFKMGDDSGYPREQKQDIDYEDMNLWQKFTFNKSTYIDDAEFYGVGNVHFSPNSESDYDWSNPTKVLSAWKDWLNYPNFKNILVETNYTAYDEENSDDVCRNHHRWWFSLMPHIEGVTDDGYSNNWWQYFVTLDFVVDIEFVDDMIEISNGSRVPAIKCKVIYQSGKEKIVTINVEANNFMIENNDVLKLEGNELFSINEGISEIQYCLDGVFATTTINVGPKESWCASSPWAQSELVFSNNQNLVPEILYGKDYTEYITREEFVTLCVRLYEELTDKKIKNTELKVFEDTRNPEVMKAYALGITNGTTDTTFSPNGLISREQMATMMARTMEICDLNIKDFSQYNNFRDHNEISDWAIESIYRMASNDILKGIYNGFYDPKGNTTIEQAVVVVGRCLKIKNNG